MCRHTGNVLSMDVIVGSAMRTSICSCFDTDRFTGSFIRPLYPCKCALLSSYEIKYTLPSSFSYFCLFASRFCTQCCPFYCFSAFHPTILLSLTPPVYFHVVWHISFVSSVIPYFVRAVVLNIYCSPTLFPSQALCVCKEAAPSLMAGWKSIWEECGGLSVAMTGGTKTLQWFADSWARGERAHMHTHALRRAICAALCLPLPITYVFRHRCKDNPLLSYKCTMWSSLQRLDIWLQCDGILVGISQHFQHRHTHACTLSTVFVLFLCGPCIPTPLFPRGI